MTTTGRPSTRTTSTITDRANNEKAALFSAAFSFDPRRDYLERGRPTGLRRAAVFFVVAFAGATLRAEAVFAAAVFAPVARRDAVLRGAVAFFDAAAFFADARFLDAVPTDAGATSALLRDDLRASGSLDEFSGRHERPPKARSVSAEAGPALPEA